MAKLKCPFCEKLGANSVLIETYIEQTDLHVKASFSPKGEYHYHDPNIKRVTYLCSKEHTFKITTNPVSCPTCGDWWWQRTKGKK